MRKVLSIFLILILALGTFGNVLVGAADGGGSSSGGSGGSGGSTSETTETVSVNVDVQDENTVIEIGRSNSGYTDSYEYSGSNYASTYFDLRAELNLEAVNEKLLELVSEKVEAAQEADVTGLFTVEIDLPIGLVLSDNYYDTTTFEIENGSDFEDFYVIPEKEDVEVSNNVITFEIALKDGLKGSDLFDYDAEADTVTSKLGDTITVTCRNAISPRNIGTYNINVDIEGYTDITKADDSVAYRLNYDFGNIPTAKLTVDRSSSSGSGSGGSGGGSRWPSGVITVPTTPSTSYTVEYILGTGTVSDLTDRTVTSGTTITLPETAGTRAGYVFDGWIVNGEHVDSGEVTITGNTTIAAKWINTVPTDGLNATDHNAYLQGYPDGTIKPEADITRAEVVTILYRLLTEEKRAEIYTEDCTFADVPNDYWARTAIATMEKGGYINGYEDGSFQMNNPITRAEFVTIISRFAAPASGLKSYYSDIAGHWAADNIKLAADLAWINGYEDGVFRPDDTISRAEVVKIINRMLVRYADSTSFDPSTVKSFTDNAESAWYYYDIIEATNGHTFDRRDDGYNENWSVVEASEGFEF